MPELAEVARVVHYIRNHVVGKTISKVIANKDEIVFGKVGTSAEEFEKTMQGKKVIGAGQQGKYFWITMSEPPHPVMHFGMTGWLHIKGQEAGHYRGKKEDPTWPPKFMKFCLVLDGNTEAAFSDARRLGRVRLVDCPGEDIRKHSPLKENGPDPIADKGVITEPWLKEKLGKKRVPIKAFLLDQSIISGLGNWMADEVLYHAQIHPEEITNLLDDGHISELTSSIHYVCATSVDLLGDSARFPADWLMHHRWSKGKKEAPKMLNGDPLTFITVGGRTSALVPTVQKKLPYVKGVGRDVDDDPKPQSKSRSKTVKKETDDSQAITAPKKVSKTSKASGNKVKEEVNGQGDAPKTSASDRKRRSAKAVSEDAGTKAVAPPAKRSKPNEQPKVPLRRGRSATAKK